jgi:DNA-directed RNA polymerase subunit RPC12/RpoP
MTTREHSNSCKKEKSVHQNVEFEAKKEKELRTTYICGNCGRDVPLTKTELVKCKICGCRYVFKKRTSSCIYLAI